MNAKVLKTVGRWASRVLLLGLVILIAGAVIVLTILPRATHGAALTVLTGSMTPTIPVGSVVLDRPVDPGTLHVGDIATYQAKPGVADFVTHRIVAINTNTTPVTFTFKGDANRGPDLNAVPATAIRGKVWFHVPYLGGIRDALHAKGGFALCAFVVLVGYAIVQAVGIFRDRRKKATGAGRRGNTATPEAAAAPAANEIPIAISADSVPAQRRMFLAAFRSGLQGRLSRESITWLLGGTVVDEDDTSFTVFVIEAAELQRRTDALLETLEPLSIETLLVAQRSLALLPSHFSRWSTEPASETARLDNEVLTASAAPHA